MHSFWHESGRRAATRAQNGAQSVPAGVGKARKRAKVIAKLRATTAAGDVARASEKIKLKRWPAELSFIATGECRPDWWPD